MSDCTRFRFQSTALSAIVIFLLTAIVVITSAQEDKKKLQKKKSQLERDIQETNRELERTKQIKTDNLNQVLLINRKINKREELIDELENEVGGIDGEIGRINDTIAKIEQNLTNLRQEYAGLVYSTYRNHGAMDRLMFVFASRNFFQAYKRLQYMRQYSAFRKQQVQQITHTQQSIIVQKLELENTKSSKIDLKHRQEQEKTNLAAEKSEKDQKIKNLSAQEKKLLATLRDQELALKKLQATIEALVAAEIKKANEERARKAREMAENKRRAEALAAEKRKAEASKKSASKSNKPSKETTKPASANKAEPLANRTVEVPSKPVAEKVDYNTNSMSSTSEEIALSGSFASNKGNLPSPIDHGSIVSSFGEHAHPEFQNVRVKNNGIDLVAAPSAPIKAVFNGEVSSTIYIANLNYVVIIRHGDYLTVYSNLQSVNVKKGDKVKIRQTIGVAAADNSGSRSRLHFELWLGTQVLNPSSWLRI